VKGVRLDVALFKISPTPSKIFPKNDMMLAAAASLKTNQ
jgi:hypothetical protein